MKHTFKNLGRSIGIAATLGLLFGGPQAHSQQATVIHQPQEITLEEGETFTLLVRIDPAAQPISVADLFMQFDPTYLQVVSVTPLSEGLNMQHLPGTFNNETGEIAMGAMRMEGELPAGTFSVLQVELLAQQPVASTAIYHNTAQFPRTLLAFNGQNRTGSIDETQVTITAAGVLSDANPGLGNWQTDLSVWPVPTRAETYISFGVQQPERVVLEVFDISGHLIGQVYSGEAVPGQEYRFEFDSRMLANGVYFIRLSAGSGVSTARMVVAR